MEASVTSHGVLAKASCCRSALDTWACIRHNVPFEQPSCHGTKTSRSRDRVRNEREFHSGQTWTKQAPSSDLDLET